MITASVTRLIHQAHTVLTSGEIPSAVCSRRLCGSCSIQNACQRHGGNGNDSGDSENALRAHTPGRGWSWMVMRSRHSLTASHHAGSPWLPSSRSSCSGVWRLHTAPCSVRGRRSLGRIPQPLWQAPRVRNGMSGSGRGLEPNTNASLTNRVVTASPAQSFSGKIKQMQWALRQWARDADLTRATRLRRVADDLADIDRRLPGQGRQAALSSKGWQPEVLPRSRCGSAKMLSSKAGRRPP